MSVDRTLNLLQWRIEKILYEDVFGKGKMNHGKFQDPVPLLISYADSATIAVNPYYPVNAQLTAIQVNDLARNVSYTWIKNTTYPSGYWANNMASSGMTSAAPGATPLVTPGNNLQIAVSVFNMGTVGGTITVTVENASTSAVLNSQALTVTPQGNVATNFVTLTMPTTAFSILVSATP